MQQMIDVQREIQSQQLNTVSDENHSIPNWLEANWPKENRYSSSERIKRTKMKDWPVTEKEHVERLTSQITID